MEVYLVGGAIRNKLLHLPVKDHDYVVLKTSPQEMILKGYLPVGKSHHVFLHPQTKEEYTLAETLPEDLSRRDLTINALAEDESGHLIDLYGGKSDIDARVFRHIKQENFFEDPARLYRVARFSAELPFFKIHPDLYQVLRSVAEKKLLASISLARVYNELLKALESDHPEKFFQVLLDVDALSPHFDHPDLDLLRKVSAKINNPEIRFASLGMELNFVPNEWKEAARAVHRFSHLTEHLFTYSPEQIVDAFYQMDAFRKPKIVKILALIQSIKNNVPDKHPLEIMFENISKIKANDIPKSLKGKQIGEAIKSERVRRLQGLLP